MRDIELYQQLLGLAGGVDGDAGVGGRCPVDVGVDHPRGTRFACDPHCVRELFVYDHAAERAWRHLDSCQFLTFRHAGPPRVQCPEHGVHQVGLAWAEPMSRFTILFERLAIDVLRECDVTGAAGAAAAKLGRGLAPNAPGCGPGPGRQDAEGAQTSRGGREGGRPGPGLRHRRVNLDAGTVEHITDERRQASLDAYFARFTPKQRKRIKAVAMDMWQPYIDSVREHLTDPDDKIVFDRYHVMTYLNTAVDTVRVREHRALAAASDSTLVATKYLWLYAAENLPDKHADRFAALRAVDLKTRGPVGDRRPPHAGQSPTGVAHLPSRRIVVRARSIDRRG